MTATTGTLYDKTLDTAAVARLFRADLKGAIARGELPAMKLSVTMKRFSGGSSIVIELKAASFQVHSDTYLDWYRAADWDAGLDRDLVYTETGARVLAALKAIGEARRFSDCDSMTDHFNVSFWLHVDVASELRAAELAGRAPTLEAR